MTRRVVAPNGQPGGGTFFGRLRPDQQAELARMGSQEHFGDGDCLLAEGGTSLHVFLLRRGWVKVVGAMANGKEALLAVRVAGDLVGELGVFDSQPRIATVRAAGECRALRIEGRDFLAFLARHPDVSLAVSASVAAKLRFATRRRVEFSTCTTQVRTARILVELARTYGKHRDAGTEIVVPLTQAELAALAGTTEATLQRILGAFRQTGVIATGYRRMVVLDDDRLSALAEPPGTAPAG